MSSSVPNGVTLAVCVCVVSPGTARLKSEFFAGWNGQEKREGKGGRSRGRIISAISAVHNFRQYTQVAKRASYIEKR